VNRLSDQDPELVPDYRRLFRLDERVFIVLGGGAGIGRQSSHALAQAGATVVVVDQDEAAAAAVAAQVGGIALAGDVARRGSVERIFADAARQAGPVTGVVDIVGVASLGPLARMDDAGWDRQFDLVLRHAYLALQIGGQAIAEAGGGAMVFVGSISGYAHADGEVAYGAAKAALHHLVAGAARELAPQRVRVNAIAPGYTRTPRLLSLMGEQRWKDIDAMIPRGIAAVPAEIAAPIAFLASDAASYISGQILGADGGLAGIIPSPFTSR
jgi:NAD(P)-dependent dehydrogenase (short-subunit alcohol dehydrogenase family)